MKYGRNNFNLCIQDTDSISFSRKDKKPFSPSEQKRLLWELNSLMRDGIVWENDGIFKTIIAVAAKNYVLDDGEKVTIKGSALKATKKEPALKKFIREVIDLILANEQDQIPDLYMKYVKRILSINDKTDISEWCFKVTATKKVLVPTTPFNTKVLNALIDAKIDVIEGDKYYMYFKPGKVKTVKNKKTGKQQKKVEQNLACKEMYQNDICKMTLLKKLYVTMKIFHRVYDISNIPNLTLKKHQKVLSQIKSVTHQV